MKVIIFGATGRTGKYIVKEALAKGHDVTAFMRNELAMLNTTHPGLKKIQGDVLMPNTVEEAIKGHDVVILAIGVNTNEPTSVLSRGTEHVVNAMQKHNIKRIICLSSAGIFENDSNFMFQKIIKPFFMKHIFHDKIKQLRVLEGSNLDWTLVRASQLIDIPWTGNIQISYDKPKKNKIGRADVADFIVAQIKESNNIKKMPIISN